MIRERVHRARQVRGFDVPRGAVATVAGAAAAVAALLAVALRLARNGPTDLPGVAALYPIAEAGALAVPAAAALALGFAAREPAERIGFAAMGAFGGLAVFVPAARVPATGAVVAGGALVAGRRLRLAPSRQSIRRGLVAATVLAGAAVSLGGATGLLPPPARSVGSVGALLALAATPVFVRPRWTAWAAGALAFLGVFYAAGTAPFVTGAAVLVGGGVVGAPTAVIALGAAGGTTTVAAGIDGRDRSTVVGGALLLAAGVPATVPRALAAALGVAFLTARLDAGEVDPRE